MLVKYPGQNKNYKILSFYRQQQSLSLILKCLHMNILLS